MSEDVCRVYSTGHIGTLSNQQLSESLVHERLRSEQHRLNYEKLRSLYEKLQNDMNTLTTDETDVRKSAVKQDEREGGGTVSTTKVPTELIKSQVKRYSSQKQTQPNVGPSTTSMQDHINLPSTFLSPGSSTGLPDDKIEDIIPALTATASPQNEILRQCSRWKELYLSLLDEFQQYKYLNDVLLLNNDQVLAEKVREANHELDEIREEQDSKLEKLRSKLDNLMRERIVFQTEIKAIRSQLVETNEKLGEKTILCEALQRQIDEHSMNSLNSHGTRCEIPSHTELENKLSAAEGRVIFLQDEVNEISNSNTKLQDKIFSLIRESTHEITSLRKALSGNEEQVVKTQVDFQYQQDEALQHLQVQQAYIEDLDKFVNERVEQNNEVSKKVQDFATQVAQETEQTLQLLEDRLQKTTEEKEALEEALVKASTVIHDLTDEARKQRVTASRFITHIYQILSIPPGENRNEVCELRTLPYVVLCDNIINSINDDSELAHTYAINTSIHMKELLKRVIFWSRQFELQKKRLRERVTELEQQKQISVNDIDRYHKKCEFYREILKQLRKELGAEVMDATLKNGLPRHTYEQAKKWFSKHKNSFEQEVNVGPTTSSTDKLGEAHGERSGSPELTVTRVSQAQHKFGLNTQMTVRPYISNNLHNYLKRHERFSHILENVSQYLSQPENFLSDQEFADIDS